MRPALYAEDASAARQFVATAPDIKLLLIDVVLPGGISGPEIAAELRNIHPELKTVFMSGYPADEIDHGSIRTLGSPLLNKPFAKEMLARVLKDAW